MTEESTPDQDTILIAFDYEAEREALQKIKY